MPPLTANPQPGAATDPAEDLGLFGPDSITWRVLADPAMGIGGLRALFLQALHPLAMAGVYEHSDYQASFWPRLRHTAEYVSTVGFSPTAQVESVAARVRQMHTLVHGTDAVTGLRYSAQDPDLLTWVHVTEVSSFLHTARRGGLTLTGAEQDQFLAEQVRAARLLGADEVPASRAEVAQYLQRVRPQLRCSSATRDAARVLLVPPMPWRVQLLTPARPAWSAVALLGFSLLPAWARRMYRLPGLPTTDLAAGVLLRGLRTVALALPERVRVGPPVQQAWARAASSTTGSTADHP
ncbi:oxygenase MpaB family protein [Rhodococcus sp. X156]|uniref:oxygenase MpaB family protein n=1 Tax=Rhodococcus sp. X156 TaxID=2499145 RepID=UPI000FDB3024|nr:oxygenase MpaB family protein [Rhodococcus sp. X156]